MRRTATTANAILGLLALRPEWSTWELTQEMRRNLRFFWPRAESRIYDELGRLRDAGLVETRLEHTGRRRRTIWAITDDGRERLAEWLAAPPRGAYVESEPVLRLLLGNLTGEAQWREAIARIRADAAEMADVADDVARAYEAGVAPFQQHIANRALVHSYLTGQAAAMLTWADAAENYLDAGANDADALATIRHAASRLARARRA
jgi:DNA-binding PadR family transcriptional regulator